MFTIRHRRAARRAARSRRQAVKKRVKQVLFVQGGGGNTHDSWDNRLVASLEQVGKRGKQLGWAERLMLAATR